MPVPGHSGVRNLMKLVNTVCYVVVIGWSQVVMAKGLRKESAHAHGQSQMNLISEAKNLQLEWVAPADDLLGFEHKPRNDQEKNKVAEVVAKLKDNLSIVHFSEAAKCRLKNKIVNVGIFADHDKHEHSKESKGKDKSSHHGEHGCHHDLKAQWTFECEQPEALKGATFKVHENFPQVKKVQLQFIVHGRPGKVELSAGKANVFFPASK